MAALPEPGARTTGRAQTRPADEGPRCVGAALKQARERRGLTLEEVGRAVRCPARQVLAVEEGRTGGLPPHPYARGLVTAYAALMGLDADAAAREWGRWPGDEDGGGTRIFRVPVRTRSSWRDWAVPIACACGAAAYVALGALQRPSPVEIPAPRPAAISAGDSAEPPAEMEGEAAAPPAAAADEPGLTVLLHSEGSTWVEVSADGEERRRQELGPGQQLALRARQRLGLALADAGAVRISVNGRDLGFIGDKGESRAGIVFEAPGPAKAPQGGARASRER